MLVGQNPAERCWPVGGTTDQKNPGEDGAVFTGRRSSSCPITWIGASLKPLSANAQCTHYGHTQLSLLQGLRTSSVDSSTMRRLGLFLQIKWPCESCQDMSTQLIELLFPRIEVVPSWIMQNCDPHLCSSLILSFGQHVCVCSGIALVKCRSTRIQKCCSARHAWTCKLTSPFGRRGTLV